MEATCAAGQVAISGGWTCDNNHVWVLESSQNGASKWKAVFMKDISEARSCSVCAVCVTLPADD